MIRSGADTCVRQATGKTDPIYAFEDVNAIVRAATWVAAATSTTALRGQGPPHSRGWYAARAREILRCTQNDRAAYDRMSATFAAPGTASPLFRFGPHPLFAREYVKADQD